MHAHLNTHARTHTHTLSLSFPCVCVCVCVQPCVHARTHTHTLSLSFPCVCVEVCVCARVCERALDYMYTVRGVWMHNLTVYMYIVETTLTTNTILTVDSDRLSRQKRNSYKELGETIHNVQSNRQ